MATTANNQSRKICQEIADKNGWKKELRRNVVVIDGESWSFSVSNDVNRVSCRQCYEDTKGFISYCIKTDTLHKYEVDRYDIHSVSRISPSGTKAFNVNAYKVECYTI